MPVHHLKEFKQSCTLCNNVSKNNVPERKAQYRKNIIPRDRRILMRKRGKLLQWLDLDTSPDKKDSLESKIHYIIYTWKILESIVPSSFLEDKSGITNLHLPRLGRTCYRNALESTSQQHNTFLSPSFLNVGPRLFNNIPREIQDLIKCTTETIKRRLDKLLGLLPDGPPIPHNPTARTVESNSILDQIQCARMEQRCGDGGFPSLLWWRHLNFNKTRQ